MSPLSLLHSNRSVVMVGYPSSSSLLGHLNYWFWVTGINQSRLSELSQDYPRAAPGLPQATLGLLWVPGNFGPKASVPWHLCGAMVPQGCQGRPRWSPGLKDFFLMQSGSIFVKKDNLYLSNSKYSSTFSRSTSGKSNLSQGLDNDCQLRAMTLMVLMAVRVDHGTLAFGSKFPGTLWKSWESPRVILGWSWDGPGMVLGWSWDSPGIVLGSPGTT
ncbi:hypothetical protein K435DRAFT_799495 [Dendrothele bispora CBS 962.96]|uniref:Uncharacterized protein n=1 Tax=Dendrothele bispora (strain CBS 962.96) TaxID=1314807 RepID=A0A4S8LVT0_DENBC|nr:hypothetical protein K435DRAFT_799495 [Dendrothele bispora CBS 962.96]